MSILFEHKNCCCPDYCGRILSVDVGGKTSPTLGHFDFSKWMYPNNCLINGKSKNVTENIKHVFALMRLWISHIIGRKVNFWYYTEVGFPPNDA